MTTKANSAIARFCLSGFYRTTLKSPKQQYIFSTEKAIVLAFRRGEPAALRWILEQTYPPLYYFAQGVICSSLDAEDIIACTFSRLYQMRNKLASLNEIREWLFKTVRHYCINYFITGSVDVHGTMAGMTETIEKRVETERVKTVLLSNILIEIDKIPQPGATVFRLYFFEKKTAENIAEILQMNPRKVSSMLEMALTRLNKKGIKFK